MIALAITVLCVIVALLVWADHCYRRAFINRFKAADKKEQSSMISEWFATTRNPSYVKFKRDFDLASNIVEYKRRARE